MTNIVLAGDQAARGAPYYELCDGGTIGFNCPKDVQRRNARVIVTTSDRPADSEPHSFMVAAF